MLLEIFLYLLITFSVICISFKIHDIIDNFRYNRSLKNLSNDDINFMIKYYPIVRDEIIRFKYNNDDKDVELCINPDDGNLTFKDIKYRIYFNSIYTIKSISELIHDQIMINHPLKLIEYMPPMRNSNLGYRQIKNLSIMFKRLNKVHDNLLNINIKKKIMCLWYLNRSDVFMYLDIEIKRMIINKINES